MTHRARDGRRSAAPIAAAMILALVLSLVPLTVYAAPANKVSSITLSLSPVGTLTYGTGSSITYAVAVIPSGGSGGSGSALLTMSGTVLPAGVTASFSPTPVTLVSGDSTPIAVVLSLTSTGNLTCGLITP